MQQKHLVLTCVGSAVLMLASASYAADTPTDASVNPTPEAAANSPAEAAPGPQPQVAVETPVDAGAGSTSAERMATDPCAGQAGASTSLDCEKLKRRGPTEKTAQASSMAVCTSHLDPKGKVIYDDPACPSRMHPVVNNPDSIYLIRENPFFNLHIEKAIDHARAAEMAGNQGQAVELLEHAQMSFNRAKEAQRAGNVPGLNEGISSLREALRLPEGSRVREATAYVRDARKNLAQAAGMKYVEIQPQGMVAASTER